MGGAVRDLILGRESHDYDIATNMSIEELEKLFPHNFPSGIDYGVITVFENHHPYEIAHYRTDIQYKDCRHPEIAMTESIEEDLKRRDFTMNALAWKDGMVLDFFGGQEDIKNQIIRAVGEPDKRIKEDALRIMRAVRFSAQLGFDIDPGLYEAMKNNAALIEKISWERIEAEMTKILISKHPEKIRLLYELGITKYILPEFDKLMKCEQNSEWHIANVGDHTIMVIQAIKDEKILRWAALLHDIGKPNCKVIGEDGKDHFPMHPSESYVISYEILERFKFSKKERDDILWLVKRHDSHDIKKSTMRKWIGNYGKEAIIQLIELQRADGEGQSEKGRKWKREYLPTLQKMIREIEEEDSAFKLKDLKVNGYDVMKAGFAGKEIGNVLNNLYEEVLEHPEMNERGILVDKIAKLKEDTQGRQK